MRSTEGLTGAAMTMFEITNLVLLTVVPLVG